MKPITNFLGNRLARRLLSGGLTICLLAGLMPAATVPASAAGAVVYNRAAPETAVLNADTGISITLYNQLVKGEYPAYNAISLFGLAADSRVKDAQEYTWSGYGDSQLRNLSKISGNLEANLSATFYNREHIHSHWKGIKSYSYQFSSYESVALKMAGSFPVYISGFLAGLDFKYPRGGNLGTQNQNIRNLDGLNPDEPEFDSYGPVAYHESPANSAAVLTFNNEPHYYWHFDDMKTCTCKGPYAENMLLTFRDTRAPQLSGVQYSTDGGNSWIRKDKGVLLNKDQTLTIKLSFDEPIRFADDSANHGDLHLRLQADGEASGSGIKAELTKLDGQDLYFTYTLEEAGKELTIVSLELEELFGSGIPLVQLNGTGNFTLDSSLQGDKGTKGFSTSGSYITDLAGNAITQKSVTGANIRLDSAVPYVKSVGIDLALNNGDVKEALGKDTLQPGTEEYDRNYADFSDTYLGVGDSVTFTIYMNERLQGIALTDVAQGRVIDWQHAVATTNIKDRSGSYVTVRSRFFAPYYDSYSGDTYFVMQPVTIEEGWTVDGNGGKITVTKFALEHSGGGYGTLADQVTDRAGNALNKSDIRIDVQAFHNPPELDVVAPTVKEIADSYAVEDAGFRYGVQIADDASGCAGIYGSFILNNGGDKKAYQYEWAVTADPNTNVTEWQIGTAGMAQRFVQTEQTYFHIRPLSSENYGDLSSCTITVRAQDYAGNESDVTLPSGSSLNWYIDNLPPVAKAGGTERRMNGDNSGTLTATVIFTDSNGISAWQYAWSDSDTTAPTSWTEGNVTASDASPVSVTAAAMAPEGQLFSRYLWVRATDNSGKRNTSEAFCLGQYEYDLRAADYSLSYSLDIQKKASLTVTSIADADALFFLVQAADSSEYALLRCYGGAANVNSVTGDLFDKAWESGYTLTGENGIYRLQNSSSGNAAAAIANVKSGTFSGNLTVKVLSGRAEACNSTTGEAAWVLGDGTYPFSEKTITLKLAGTGNNYRDISITSTNAPGGGLGSLAAQCIPTLAGIQFKISIAQDRNGWGYQDIDWESSYVELTNVTEESNASYRVALKPVSAAADGSVSQTVTVPEDEYETGIYQAKLHIECTLGKDYDIEVSEDGTTKYMMVDAVKPNSDFSMTALTYTPQTSAYGIGAFYGTRDCLGSRTPIILPVRDGVRASNTGDFTVSSPTEDPVVYRTYVDAGNNRHKFSFGQYVLQMWNTDDPGQKITITPADADNTQQKVESGSYGFVSSRDGMDTAHSIYLTPDKVNTVAMQKVYSNGRTSGIQYVQIKPVTEFVTGTVSVDTAAGELVFTPAAGISTAGAQIYAWAWQSNPDPTTGDGQRIDMDPTADGTWRCKLLEGGAQYKVITVNSSGSICEAGGVTEQAPKITDCAVTDGGDGTYTLTFRVTDDVNTMENGISLDIGFNENYTKERHAFTDKSGYAGSNSYKWVETGESSTGILSVETSKGTTLAQDYMNVTVKGSYVPNRSGNDLSAAQTMQITVTATDALGHSTSVSTAEQTAAYQKPRITDDTLPDKGYGLKLTFNQPVRPTESWAWREADRAGFWQEWEGAFPIAANGTYEVQYKDVFGNLCTEELTTDAFTISGKDWSVDLEFADPNRSGDSIFLVAKPRDGYILFRDGYSGDVIWKADGCETTRVVLDTGEEWALSTSHMTADNAERKYKNAGAKQRDIMFEKNYKIYVSCYKSSYPESVFHVFRQAVYIDGLVQGAPAADVRYYVGELGQEFTETALQQYIAANGGSVEITGDVRVWYKTSRAVTATAGGTEFVFTPENQTATHTFVYQDELENQGSATVALPAGLTLKAPVIPPVDNTPPDADVDIYVKRGGVYSRADAFHSDDAANDITARFVDLGYVQGYSLTVNASDASGIGSISVTGDGAVCTGNVVTVTKAGTFTITVTDKSEMRNKKEFTVIVPDKIDGEAPTADVELKGISLYSKVAYIRLKDNSGAENVVLDMPALAVVPAGAAAEPDKSHIGWYKLTLTGNGSTQLFFHDQAGNSGTATVTANGIDTSPPKLTVTWSPSRTYTDADTGKLIHNEEYPAEGWLNTNVTAHINSDKPLSRLTVTWNGTEIYLLTDDPLNHPATNPCLLADGSGKTLVQVTAAAERVTITYLENCTEELTFTAAAPNGSSVTETVSGVNNIDKTAPTVAETKDELIRTGFTVPYAVEVTLTPNERVTSPNYGKTELVNHQVYPEYYDSNNPLKLTFTENGAYNVRLVDEAGNVTIYPVTIAGIDRTAPVLTMGEPIISGQSAAVRVKSNEDCKITANGTLADLTANAEKELTFTQNGTFTIIAVDAAGNQSYYPVVISRIDNILPSISFAGSTISLLQGTSDTELTERLNAGYTVWDNVTAANSLSVHFDSSSVNLNEEGLYEVAYTVVDEAGNTTTANRFVRVVGNTTLCVLVDGGLILPDSTAVIRPGQHTLTVQNLVQGGPYTVKIKKGLYGLGQMKYLSGSSVTVGADGTFAVTDSGYYTVQITAQNRQTVRILLYVEA